jgi:hypothetical protein
VDVALSTHLVQWFALNKLSLSLFLSLSSHMEISL